LGKKKRGRPAQKAVGRGRRETVGEKKSRLLRGRGEKKEGSSAGWGGGTLAKTGSRELCCFTRGERRRSEVEAQKAFIFRREEKGFYPVRGGSRLLSKKGEKRRKRTVRFCRKKKKVLVSLKKKDRPLQGEKGRGEGSFYLSQMKEGRRKETPKQKKKKKKKTKQHLVDRLFPGIEKSAAGDGKDKEKAHKKKITTLDGKKERLFLGGKRK